MRKKISDNENIVKVLLQNGARVNVADEKGNAALHLAADYGHTEIAKILIDGCASLDIRDETGRVPLHFASKSGKLNHFSLNQFIQKECAMCMDKELVSFRKQSCIQEKITQFQYF